MCIINPTKYFKNNTYIQQDFFKEFFYDLYFQSIIVLNNNKKFLPVHISCSCNEKNQIEINKEVELLITLKKNFICVKEFTNNKEHFHIILLEYVDLFKNNKLYKKRNIVNILQFYNVVQYITKEVFVNNSLKKNNIIFFLKKFDKNYESKELNIFMEKYIKYYL